MATNPADKGSFLRSGMEKSITKVESFGSNDSEADLALAPTALSISNYIDTVVNNFLLATSTDQENIFAEQYFISMYGNGVEAYNYYRKTGYPTTLAPSWNATTGPFPRSFLYPKKESNLNFQVNTANLTKKLTDQVFWDTNPASPTFPIAN